MATPTGSGSCYSPGRIRFLGGIWNYRSEQIANIQQVLKESRGTAN